jgi:hypothetical protein
MSVVINGSAGVTTNSGAVYNGLQTDTAKTATGTSVDFTGIPSWVKRITVMFSAVSWSTTAPYLRLQLGAGSVEITGYTGAQTLINGASTASWQTTFTAGFDVSSLSAVADTVSGQIVFCTLGSNIWTMSGAIVRLGASVQMLSQFAGQKTLSGTLDRVRITTSNGTDTFDAGTINIIYE